MKKMMFIALLALSLTTRADGLAADTQRPMRTAVSASGTNTIDGAFGLVLGAKLDKELVVATNKLENPAQSFTVKAPNPHALMEDYYVNVTPQTGEICDITAIKACQSISEAEETSKILLLQISEKYGGIGLKTEKIGDATIFTGINGKDRRSIMVLVTGDVVSLNYSSQSFLAKADAEAKAIAEEAIKAKAKLIDASGL